MKFVRWRDCPKCGTLIDWSLREEHLIKQNTLRELREHRSWRKLPDDWIGDYMVKVTCQNCGQPICGIKKLENMPI